MCGDLACKQGKGGKRGILSPTLTTPPHTRTHTHTFLSLLQNYELLRRRFRMQRDSHDDLNQKLRRTEMTKNCLDTDLNSLKPEIKRLQAEKGNKLR